MVNVIGLGYIGLPTALVLAAQGVEVVGTDYNDELVATLNVGQTTFKEEGLDELFSKAINRHLNNLCFHRFFCRDEVQLIHQHWKHHLYDFLKYNPMFFLPNLRKRLFFCH